MKKQFKVGQVWADRTGRKWTITKLYPNSDYSIAAKRTEIEEFNDEGHVYAGEINSSDLVELIEDAKGTTNMDMERLRDQLLSGDLQLEKTQPEPVANTLPPEPIIGSYYMARNGSKNLYVGKGMENWIYQQCEGDPGLLRYDTPYLYDCDAVSPYDIIAPWREPTYDATFENELEALLNKHGWDVRCDTPDFILKIQIIKLLDGIRLASKLKKQWDGDQP